MRGLLSAVSALALVVGASQAFAQRASSGSTTCPPGQTCPATGATGGAKGGAATGGAATGSGAVQGGAATGTTTPSTGATGSAQGGASGSTGTTRPAAGTTQQGSGSATGGTQGTGSAQGGSGGGNTNVNVNVTTEQRTTIRQTIVAEKVAPATNVTFNIVVGTVVPKTVRLHRLPARIVQIVPAWSGYEYFLLADGRIVVVEPGTLKIIVILAA